MSTDVSNVTSHFPDAENGFTTTTSGSVSSGATTVGLNSTGGYTNGQPVVLVIDPTDTNLKQTFTGIIDTSGVQVTNVKWTAGTNTAHSAGATVVDYPTATHIAMMSKGILVQHNQDGTHGAITGTSGTFTGQVSGSNLKLTGDLLDTNGNELIKTSQTAAAANELTVTNATGGSNPRLAASGSDTDIALDLRGKGVGGVLLNLRTQKDDADSISSATTNGIRFQVGWAQRQGDGTGSINTTITFPTAFTTVMGVLVSPMGVKGSVAADLTELTTEITSNPYTAAASDITTTTFLATLTRSASTFSVGSYYAVSWIAWGV